MLATIKGGARAVGLRSIVHKKLKAIKGDVQEKVKPPPGKVYALMDELEKDLEASLALLTARTEGSLAEQEAELKEYDDKVQRWWTQK